MRKMLRIIYVNDDYHDDEKITTMSGCDGYHGISVDNSIFYVHPYIRVFLFVLLLKINKKKIINSYLYLSNELTLPRALQRDLDSESL
ncbi:hypothetical protein HanIR_Chr16g0828171 [Helianthus annuus]|nr:hypothetical protein HanIR_Chr16g0828171 [Helianthus annuus]